MSALGDEWFQASVSDSKQRRSNQLSVICCDEIFVNSHYCLPGESSHTCGLACGAGTSADVVHSFLASSLLSQQSSVHVGRVVAFLSLYTLISHCSTPF